jgi:hypothetical protein
VVVGVFMTTGHGEAPSKLGMIVTSCDDVKGLVVRFVEAQIWVEKGELFVVYRVVVVGSSGRG